MEFFALILGLFILVTLFMPWINHGRLKRIHEELERFRDETHKLQMQISMLGDPKKPSVEQSTIQDDSEQEETQTLPAEVIQGESAYYFSDDYSSEVKQPTSKSLHVPRTEKINFAEKIQNSFEQNIATKLPVWIGAVSLICAAFFLVKYSMELGWMQPSVRVSLGALFGVALLAAGQWVARRKNLANAVRISQGLVGSGLVSLYVSVYASVHLYSLIDPFIAFGAMAVITALAVVLSVKHGQPIAVFGLLGGLLTPALIGSEEPNALAMFTYLFLLFSGMFAVLVRKGWWILAIISIIGVFGWAGIWFLLLFADSDGIFLLLFAMAIMGVVMSVTGKRIYEDKVTSQDKRSIHGLNYTVIIGGILTIIWLSFKITLTLFDWSMLGLMTLAVMALTYFQPKVYKKSLYADFIISLGLLFVWMNSAPLNDAIIVLIGMGVLYIGVTAYIMRKVSDPRLWASLQGIASISLFLIAYVALPISADFLAKYSLFWGAVALFGATLAISQVQDVMKNYKEDKSIQNHLLAIYTLVASAFISLGLAIELPWQHVPLAIAAQILVTTVIYYKTKIDFLKKITVILVSIFAVLNYKQFILFLDIMLQSLFGDYPSQGFISEYAAKTPAIELGLPFLFIASSFWILVNTDKQERKTISFLALASVLLGLSTLYYTIRYTLGGGINDALLIEANFFERSVMTIILGALAVGSYKLVQYLNLPYLKFISMGLLSLTVFRLAYFDLLITNPYFSESQSVGNLPIFNGVTLIYGFAILLSYWAITYIEDLKYPKLYKVLGFISLFALVSLNVRQFFNGSNIVEGNISEAELYTYSVAWLCTGLGLLTLGIMKVNKTARMASLAFILFAVVKVFLFDASELEGLYRVFSFLGLGLSLIGLSYFYTKFVFSEQNKESPVA